VGGGLQIHSITGEKQQSGVWEQKHVTVGYMIPVQSILFCSDTEDVNTRRGCKNRSNQTDCKSENFTTFLMEKN